VVWSPDRSIPAKDFSFTDAEIVRIKGSLETWVSYGAAIDRRWPEPLLSALLAP
jgi:hypothetical protein